MNIEDIINNCKYLQFPSLNSKDKVFFQRKPNPRVDTSRLYNLPLLDDKMTYIGLKNNYHHYTTDYHRKYVLPLLNDIYKFGYNENDFVIKKNIIKDINEITNKQDIYDLSYLFLKKIKFLKLDL